MMPTTTVVFDGPDYQIVETSSAPELPLDQPGGSVSRQQVWKPGSTGANLATLQSRAVAALTTNAAFLAIASPTAAQVRDQVILVTKELNALIRLSQNMVATITDTA